MTEKIFQNFISHLNKPPGNFLLRDFFHKFRLTLTQIDSRKISKNFFDRDIKIGKYSTF